MFWQFFHDLHNCILDFLNETVSFWTCVQWSSPLPSSPRHCWQIEKPHLEMLWDGGYYFLPSYLDLILPNYLTYLSTKLALSAQLTLIVHNGPDSNYSFSTVKTNCIFVVLSCAVSRSRCSKNPAPCGKTHDRPTDLFFRLTTLCTVYTSVWD